MAKKITPLRLSIEPRFPRTESFGQGSPHTYGLLRAIEEREARAPSLSRRVLTVCLPSFFPSPR